MTQTTPTDVFVTCETTAQGREITLHGPGTDLRRWCLPRRPSEGELDAAGGELAVAIGEAAVACCQTDELTGLLSRPAVLPRARRVLGRLTDLTEAALICRPRESVASLAPASGPAPARDLPPAAAATELVHHRLCESAAQMPEPLRAILATLLGQDGGPAWLPWTHTPPDPVSLLLISSLLPRRPPPRRRKPADADLPGDLTDLAGSLLSPGGPIHTTLPGYEHRAGQIEMAVRVAEALRDERMLLAEAGTGVGKSLAYLVPAVIWAHRSGEPVVVSTNTHNLQEQLMDKDLPLLRRALGIKFEAALVKGRANYPCIRALVAAALDAANSLFRSERVAAAPADLADIRPEPLALIPELGALIARVRSQADACAGRTCSYNDCCPVEVTRAHARGADIVVSNHALTFADARASILPDYTRLIFDEAQNIETVATDQLSLECSGYGYSQLLRALSGEPASFVAMMRRRLDALKPDQAVVAATGRLEPLPALAEAFAQVTADLGDAVAWLCREVSSDGPREADRATVRLTEKVRATSQWGQVAALGTEALQSGTALLEAVAEFGRKLAEVDLSAAVGMEGLGADAEAMRGRLDTSLQSLEAVLASGGSHSDYVTWAETWQTRRGQSWSLHAAPVAIGPVLDEVLYQHKASIVFTSATMTVDGEFRFFRQRLGLDKYQERLVETSVPSPFALTEQLLLCVPHDIPDPRDAGYSEATTEALRRICVVAGGGTLILFTARSRMRQAFEALEADLMAWGMIPLCQDVSGPRGLLLDRLRDEPGAVLFGLKSFWEGVDVPGRALRCVVICKLPFAVPSDPIIEARQEDVARRGDNPMHDYYIPEAVVGFKQGLGRLIRTTTDTGVVFVLDRRILTRGYGRRFFRSIQRCELSRDSLDDCLAMAGEWLGKEQ